MRQEKNDEEEEEELEEEEEEEAREKKIEEGKEILLFSVFLSKDFDFFFRFPFSCHVGRAWKIDSKPTRYATCFLSRVTKYNRIKDILNILPHLG